MSLVCSRAVDLGVQGLPEGNVRRAEKPAKEPAALMERVTVSVARTMATTTIKEFFGQCCDQKQANRERHSSSHRRAYRNGAETSTHPAYCKLSLENSWKVLPQNNYKEYIQNK